MVADQVDDRLFVVGGLGDFRDLLHLEPGRPQHARRARVATSWKPSPASAAATGHADGLSLSRTERNAVPLVGSGRPAARSALAKAVGRSAALAITSPVERISGPSTGSEPGSARTAARPP